MHVPPKVSIIIAVLVTVGMSLLLSACGPGQITASLTLVVDTAEIAIPVIASQTSVDPAVIKAAENYLVAVNSAVSQVEPILNDNTMPASVKAAKVTSLFAGVAAANLPVGAPQSISLAVQKVADAVGQFLANFAVNGQPKVVGPNVKIKLSSADQDRVSKAAAKAQENLAKLKAVKAAVK